MSAQGAHMISLGMEPRTRTCLYKRYISYLLLCHKGPSNLVTQNKSNHLFSLIISSG